MEVLTRRVHRAASAVLGPILFVVRHKLVVLADRGREGSWPRHTCLPDQLFVNYNLHTIRAEFFSASDGFGKLAFDNACQCLASLLRNEYREYRLPIRSLVARCIAEQLHYLHCAVKDVRNITSRRSKLYSLTLKVEVCRLVVS